MKRAAWILVVAVAGCEQSSSAPAPAPASASAAAAAAATAPGVATASAVPLPATPWTAAAIAHGGVGSPPAWADGCRAAVDAALRALEAGGDPADAAVAGVVVLEDDPRFNAGTGSRVRLDGKSIQMDASVMRSDGRFGAVAGIERVRNPVKVARAVMDSPHLLLQGDGATRFARTLGMPDYDPTTADSLMRSRKQQLVLLGAEAPAEWRSFDWRAHWNFEGPVPAELSADAGAHDTVGVAVRAADGRFGVALSTGGLALALRGRVGDVPVLGAGLYAGTHGASAGTGTGERIVEAGLARQVHGWLEHGATAQQAADRAVDAVRARGDIGVIVVGARDLAAAADRPMAWAARESGSGVWRGP
jgi:isoaspartyl peptidase/L-asparaginase-like protein (Ntn-hydrolase superfamily)